MNNGLNNEQTGVIDFSVVSGWQEELEKFEVTDEGKQFFDYKPSKKYNNINLSTIYRLAEFRLKHPELRDAHEEYVVFQKQVDEEDTIHATQEDLAHIKHPIAALATLQRFEKWYAMKVVGEYDWLTLDLSRSIAYYVRIGKFPSVDSAETLEWIRDRDRKKIIIDV